MSPSEDTIADALMRDRWRRTTMVPRYTPRRWWECDVFEVTAAGYFVEHEIKLTLADFRADAKKSCRQWIGGSYVERNKHELLAAHHLDGPSRFYFVTPKDLVTPDMLPPWAGLAWWEPWAEIDGHPGSIRVIQQAPRLHTEKITDEKRMKHVHSVLYYRFHEERAVRARLVRERMAELPARTE